MKNNRFCLLFIIAFTILVMVLCGYFTNFSSPMYANLNLPSFSPSPIVFITGWLFIFVFTAISAYISYVNGKTDIMYIYALNGVLNPLWIYVFFEKANIVLALYIMLALIATLIYIIRNSQDIRNKVLLLPYLFWLFVAVIVNYSIIVLN